MANGDSEASAVLALNIQGEDKLNRLVAALEKLKSMQGGGGGIPRPVGPRGRETPHTTAELVANRIGYYAINRPIVAAFNLLKGAARTLGGELKSLTGAFGGFVSQAGVVSVAVVGLGVAMTGLLGPVASLIGGFALLRSTFNWAQSAAEDQLKVAARTRRFFPQLLGDALEDAEGVMQLRMNVAAAIFGDAADQMQAQVTRKFTEFRMGRGMAGERDIFLRWGITPDFMKRAEQIGGMRVDLNRWLEMFILKREELERQLSQTQSPEVQAAIRKRLSMMADDTVKLFDQKFSDAVFRMSSVDMARLKGNLEAARKLGDVEQGTQKAKDFNIALQSLRQTFSDLASGIGAEVQPSITQFLFTLNRKLLDVEEGGEGLGRALRQLAGEMANKAWTELGKVLDSIKPETIKDWIDYVRKWEPQETIDSFKSLFQSIVKLGESIGEIVPTIRTFTDWWNGNSGSKAQTDQPSSEHGPVGPSEAPAATAPSADPSPFNAWPSNEPAPAAPTVPTAPAAPAAPAPAPAPAPAAPGPASPAPAAPEAPAPTPRLQNLRTLPKLNLPKLSGVGDNETARTAAGLAVANQVVRASGGEAEVTRSGSDTLTIRAVNPSQRTQPASLESSQIIPQSVDEKRSLLGIPSDIDFGVNAAAVPFTGRLPFAGSFGNSFSTPFGGGASMGDGAAWGAAAADSLVNGLNGVAIPSFGVPSTSYGVSPRSAPSPTGGDTPSES